MIFRQLFEPDSSTYTYLLACPETRQAMLIDPVLDTMNRDLEVLQQLDLKLIYTLLVSTMIFKKMNTSC